MIRAEGELMPGRGGLLDAAVPIGAPPHPRGFIKVRCKGAAEDQELETD